MATQILMPALSPTMEEGKLAKWLVKEGDEVHAGDVLAEIETDKATMEFEAIDEGRIGKILVPEGAEGVKVNQPIAVLETEGEEAAPASKDISSTMQAIRDAIAPAGGTAPAPKAPLPEAPKGASTLPQGEGKKSNGAVPHTEDRVFASPL